MSERAPEVETSNGTWRELAVSRSLGSARARAEDRVQRFLDAATEIMEESGSDGDFTVQSVVERSGQSLRSFYQYFGGKHELLLALFEESVASAAAHLRQELAEIDDGLERFRCFVVGYYRLCNPTAPRRSNPLPSAPVVEFSQQLLTEHPVEAAQAFRPVVELFGDVLDDAAAAGAVRPGLRHTPLAGVVLEAIMFNAFSTVIVGAPSTVDDPAEEFLDFVLHGVATRS